MFGFTKLPALAALKGIAAADITEAQITAANAELTAEGYNLAVISESQFKAAQALETQLATANTSITTLQGTITTQSEEITRLGKQPGVLGTKSEKEEEELATSGEAMISETDAEVARLKGQKAK